MLRRFAALAIASVLSFTGLAQTASAEVPTSTGQLVWTANGYVDQTYGTVYSAPVAGPAVIGPLERVEAPSTSQRWSWGLYYDKVGGGLYLIIEDGFDLWIIPL